MIYIIFVLFNGINGQYRQRPLTVENSATSIYSQNEGKTLIEKPSCGYSIK